MKIKRFKDISFVNKLHAIIIGSILIALILFASAIIVYEMITFRDATVARIKTVANIISNSVTPALFFDDQFYGGGILRILEDEPHIHRATIYRVDGSVFADYHRDSPEQGALLPAHPNEGYFFSNNNLEMFHAIEYEGEKIGTVYINYELQEMQARLQRYAITICLVLFVSLLAAFVVASRMERMITDPVLHLAEIAGKVTREKDYSVRIETTRGDDEIGKLVVDFNRMLARIEERDKNLEKLVAERTRKLREAVKRLRKLDELKTNFYTTVSHELRTPLTSIVGFAKIINKRLEKMLPGIGNADSFPAGLSENIKQDVAIILSEGERMTAMINNILDLNRLEEDAVAWKEETVVPAEIIERSVHAVQPLLVEKGLELLMDMEDTLSVVRGDKARLTQVMINLLGNAVKFTDRGSVTCRLRRNHHEMVISVIDTGKGIMQDDHQRIFQKYQQGTTDADQCTTRTGAGLGLSICKHIVDHHQGRIWVESEVGKGSAFSFTIPIHEQ